MAQEFHAVGTIKSVIRRQTGEKTKRPGIPFFVVSLALQDGSMMEATSWQGDFVKVEMENRTIEFTYTQNPNKYGDNNRIERWTFKEGSGTTVGPSTAVVTTAYVEPTKGGINRDEQIVRQSSMNYATTLVMAMSQNGTLPWAKSGKGANAVKDPQVWLELAFTLAKSIRDRVLDGDWTVPYEPPTIEETEEQEPPEYVSE